MAENLPIKKINMNRNTQNMKLFIALMLLLSARTYAQDLTPFRDTLKKYGYTNTAGEIKIPPRYDYAHDFSEKLALVNRNGYTNPYDGEVSGGQWGFITTKGKEIIPPQYDQARSFSEGLALVNIDGKVGFINKKGKTVIPIIFEPVPSDKGQFHEGKIALIKGNAYGYIDKKGKEITPFIYSNAHSFSEGRAGVAKDLNRKWGFINEKGEEIIPLIYSRVFSFENGYSIVQLDGKWGAIDKMGHVVIAVQETSIKNAEAALELKK